MAALASGRKVARPILDQISAEARIRPEFKHINKGRKRN
jgi:hypothetical protein